MIHLPSSLDILGHHLSSGICDMWNEIAIVTIEEVKHLFELIAFN
jgi:hypothetical protein